MADNTYRAFACEPARGVYHIRKLLPCEDSTGSFTGEGYSLAVISDGHGTDKCCRSKIGSQFVVDAVLEACREFFGALEQDGGYASGDVSIAVENLPTLRKNILMKWRRAVHAHVEENPFDPEKEYKLPEGTALEHYKKGERTARMYGATIAFFAVAEKFWMAGLLGDGSVFMRTADSYVNVFPEDEDVDATGISEAVHSICDDDAIEHFELAYGLFDGGTDEDSPRLEEPRIACYNAVEPIAAVVNSDGIEKSYPDDEALGRFYEGMFRYLASAGIEDGVKGIQDQLPSISSGGSQDDIGLAGIMDMSVDWDSVPDYRDATRSYAEIVAKREAEARAQAEAIEAERRAEVQAGDEEPEEASRETAAPEKDAEPRTETSEPATGASSPAAEAPVPDNDSQFVEPVAESSAPAMKITRETLESESAAPPDEDSSGEIPIRVPRKPEGASSADNEKKRRILFWKRS